MALDQTPGQMNVASMAQAAKGYNKQDANLQKQQTFGAPLNRATAPSQVQPSQVQPGQTQPGSAYTQPKPGLVAGQMMASRRA
jgi:hypothetical protein